MGFEALHPPEFNGLYSEKNKKSALSFFSERLSGEELIADQQNKNCAFAVVVPVCDERPDRILKLILSVVQQEGINDGEVEVILIINNDSLEPIDSPVRLHNAILLEFLEMHQFPWVYVVDKSSSGREIEDCNVGKARNRGIAEAGSRFHQRGVDGWIIQTDADSYFHDQEYFLKLKSYLQENQDVIGIAGKIELVADPDELDPEKRIQTLQSIPTMLLLKKYRRLFRFLNDPTDVSLARNDIFRGAHMISRSFASATVGGVGDFAVGEDPEFGDRLQSFAKDTGKKIVGRPEGLYICSALRESTRTGSNSGALLKVAKESEIIYVPSPFDKNKQEPLTEELYNLLVEEVKKLPHGDEVVRITEENWKLS